VITGSGNVDLNLYRLATANAIATPVTIANQRVGGTGSQALSINNSATNDTFSEGLNASGSAAGTATTSGSISNLLTSGGSSTAISVGVDTASAGAKSGNVIISLASNGLTTSGYGNTAITNQTVAVSGNVYNPGAANTLTTPVSLGDVRVGGTFGTSALNITNTAAAGSFTEGLDATQGATTGSASVSGTNISNLAGGSSLSTISVGLGGAANTGTAGAKTGTVAIGFATNGTTSGLSNAALSGQTVTVNGGVYNPASAAASQTVTLYTRPGVSVSTSLSLTNTGAASAPYQETLGTTGISGTTSGFTASGSATGIAGGASGSGTLAVGGSFVSAGNYTGSTTLGLQTEAVNSSGLGNLAIADQTVNLNITAYDFATATFAKTSGDGTFGGSGNSYTLDFGTGLLTGQTYTATIRLANGLFGSGSAYQDALAGSYGTVGGVFSETANDVTSLASGLGYEFTVSFLAGSTGAFSDTLSFTGNSLNTPLSNSGIGDFTIALAGTAVPEPNVAALLGGLGVLALLRRRRN